MKKCRECRDKLVVGGNWTPGAARHQNYRCQECAARAGRTYRKANKKRRIATGKAWYKANKKHRTAWRETNKEHIAIATRAWRKANPDKIRAACRRRRALHANAEGSFTDKEFWVLCWRYGCRCLQCGHIFPLSELTRDHVIPMSRGGSDWISNIQPLCLKCNDSKGTKSTDYRR